MSCIFGRLRYVSGRFGGMTIFGALVWSVWDGAKLVKNRGFGNAPRFVSRRMEPADRRPLQSDACRTCPRRAVPDRLAL